MGLAEELSPGITLGVERIGVCRTERPVEQQPSFLTKGMRMGPQPY